MDEAIHLLCEAYLDPPDEVIVVTPTFSMYEIFAEATGAKVIRVQCGEDLRFPLEKVLASDHAGHETDRGGESEQSYWRRGLARANCWRLQSSSHAALLVDEAYFDFHGKTVMPDVARCPNLFVARTFSKAYGLAGLRIGILAGPREQMPMVRRVSSPYSVNAVALLALPDGARGQRIRRELCCAR